MSTKRNYFPIKLPCCSFILLYLTWLPSLCKIVFCRALTALHSWEISIKMESETCFGYRKSGKISYLKCILQHGRRMCFLINVQDTQISDLLSCSCPIYLWWATSSAQFPAAQRESLWLLSSIFLAYFAAWHFISVQGITTVEHEVWCRHQAREGLSEVLLSGGV